jgi:hypothetical protein
VLATVLEQVLAFCLNTGAGILTALVLDQVLAFCLHCCYTRCWHFACAGAGPGAGILPVLVLDQVLAFCLRHC